MIKALLLAMSDVVPQFNLAVVVSNLGIASIAENGCFESVSEGPKLAYMFHKPWDVFDIIKEVLTHFW